MMNIDQGILMPVALDQLWAFDLNPRITCNPNYDDVFVMALTSFNVPTTGFSQEHIQDELTDLSSQTLNIDYNTVVLVTDARAQKRTSILGIYVLISLRACCSVM
ncbi:TPA: hypothetical protein KE234_002140 [Citrobacter koseri]|nr:hypothetical protein [Citrobacter koseri]